MTKKAKNDIIKLQLSLSTSEVTQQMLAYNKDKSVYYEGKATREVLELMKDSIKDFYHYKIVDSKIIITDKAKYQNW